MKKYLAGLILRYGAADLVMDVHRYGGALLVGCALATLWLPALPLTLGLALLYIGFRRT